MRTIIMTVAALAASITPAAVHATAASAGTTAHAASYDGSPVAYWTPDGHPVDSAGFVLDGAPQLDDAHCVGTLDQRFFCLEARWGQALIDLFQANAATVTVAVVSYGGGGCGESVARWEPELEKYPWPVAEMEKIMCRESRGDPTERNRSSGACGLFQDLPAYPGCTDGYTNIDYSFHEKYARSGLAPWAQTA